MPHWRYQLESQDSAVAASPWADRNSEERRAAKGLAARWLPGIAANAQQGVWPDRVTMALPALDQCLGFVERAEQLGIQQVGASS